MKRKRILLIAAISLILLVSYFVFSKATDTEGEAILVPVKKGDFSIVISSSGELRAKNSVDITGPQGLRDAQIWNVRIDKMIPEGKVVKKGDFVANLDRSALIDKLRTRQSDLDKAIAAYTQTKLDTTLELRETRDNLINLQYSVEEKKLIVEQSQYEPPATIQQAKMDLEKAKRTLSQAEENYKIKRDKAIARMQEAAATLSLVQSSVDFMEDLLKEFTINAPENGMVVYQKSWRGNKVKEGSEISAWNPVVATLPDLTVMISKTYVNEVDIRKVQKGQPVEIGLDAFPDKQLTGKVISVANVGEQRPNSDSKVFEVEIEISESDSTILPAMTTSNHIITDKLENQIYVPLEAIFSENDSLTFVYKKEGLGLKKQMVKVGKSNENEIVILEGLKEDDMVSLTAPPSSNKEVALK
ncbi:MAG: efflux RND transporter periplasmic adaptor subunit [Bernardetiaceae bacterium]|nr:efflux RND transporter periplasmic adaptor subunit [Bernardetiaceae bacterium]